MIRLKKNGVRWLLRPEFEPLLDGVLSAPARLVRDSPAKLISVHCYRGSAYYVKRYRNDAFALRPLKFLFKRSHARREWLLAHRIESLGVPIVKHLACGERWSITGLQESILITEGFDGVALPDCSAAGSDETQAALARLLRQSHDRGVLQRDLQRNILVRDRPLQLRRIDVHHAEIKPVVTEQERIDNLALLNVAVPLTDKFFEAYGWNPALARRTRQRSEQIRRHYCALRSRRCFRHTAQFAPRRIGKLTWHVRLPFLSNKLMPILENPDEFLARRARLLKPGRSSTVGAADGFVLKRHNLRTIGGLLRDLFRRSRARRAFRKAYHLELLGIATPRPVAVAERRVLRVLLRDYLVVEEIAGATDLGRYLRETNCVDREVVKRLATLVGRLHNEGFSNRDLKQTNIVLDTRREPWLIDLDGLRFVREVGERRAARDLWRLARAAANYPSVSRADRAAFLRCYCRTRGLKRVPRLQSK
jgi:tRNA A-37 threonylcarbamoyl transferase component Bud32